MQGYQTDEIRLQETFPAAWTLIWLVCDQGYDSLSNFSSKRVVSHCAGGRLLAQSEEGAAYRAHLETSVDYVSGWDEREEQSSSVLRLQNGLALLAARDDPRYEAWSEGRGLTATAKRATLCAIRHRNQINQSALFKPLTNGGICGDWV
jgi:hypothetical protein